MDCTFNKLILLFHISERFSCWFTTCKFFSHVNFQALKNIFRWVPICQHFSFRLTGIVTEQRTAPSRENIVCLVSGEAPVWFRSFYLVPASPIPAILLKGSASSTADCVDSVDDSTPASKRKTNDSRATFRLFRSITYRRYCCWTFHTDSCWFYKLFFPKTNPPNGFTFFHI